jgi:predicted 3-demethylubiquinone-9 3-methyltransferase (glyoxalase superfamily)
MQKITTYLIFNSSGKEAVAFYVSIFKNSEINSIMVMPGGDQLLHALFTLDGQEFMAMDGGPHFKFEDGISLFVTCEDQSEIDYFWEKLGNGGEVMQCGWLRDKFGVRWQIIPKALGELMSGSDQNRSMRVRDAMLKMKKIDIEGLKQAYEG